MKTLVILYGHYRTFDKTISSWINALEGCDYECRFATFDTIDHNTKCWWHGDTEEKPKLTESQLELLKKYDPSLKILKQEFTAEELNDIYATLPHKVYIYKYNIIKEILQTIDETKYDKIIISRFDILLNNIKFKDVSIEKDEIKLGFTNLELYKSYYKEIAGTDMLCMFHPINKDKFYNIPKDLLARKFKMPEECYTDFYYENFKIVHLLWNYYSDFNISRL